MKKILSAILVLCLLISVLPMAMAASLEMVTTLEGTSYSIVSGMNLLQKSVYENGVTYFLLCTLDGTVVADIPGAHYSGNGNALTLTVDYRDGVIRPDGTVVIPAEYDAVRIKGDWAIGYVFAEATEDDYDAKVYYLGAGTTTFVTFDVIALYNISKNALVQTFDRQQFADWSAQGEYINIRDRSGKVTCYDGDFNPIDYSTKWDTDFGYIPTGWQIIRDEETGLRGIVDDNGNEMTPAIYKSISESHGWFTLYNAEGQCGLADSTGKVVVEPAYDSFKSAYLLGGGSTYGIDGIFCAKTAAGSYVLINTNTGKNTTVEADDVEFLGNAMLVKSEESKSLVTADGARIPLDAKYTRVNCTGLAIGGFVIGTCADDTLDLLDAEGNVLVSGGFISLTPDGHVVVKADGNTYLYVLK